MVEYSDVHRSSSGHVGKRCLAGAIGECSKDLWFGVEEHGSLEILSIYSRWSRPRTGRNNNKGRKEQSSVSAAFQLRLPCSASVAFASLCDWGGLPLKTSTCDESHARMADL